MILHLLQFCYIGKTEKSKGTSKCRLLPEALSIAQNWYPRCAHTRIRLCPDGSNRFGRQDFVRPLVNQEEYSY